MSTEYRRGIPSVAHVEAATRLGLLWRRRGTDAEHRTRFAVNSSGTVLSDYGGEDDALLALGPVSNNERHYSYRPIRTDGTPVDWEVLDMAAVNPSQPICLNTDGTLAITVTPTAPAAPTTQPQGFRADLWRRIHAYLVNGSTGCGLPDVSSIDSMGFRVQSPFFDAEVLWPQGAALPTCDRIGTGGDGGGLSGAVVRLQGTSSQYKTAQICIGLMWV